MGYASKKKSWNQKSFQRPRSEDMRNDFEWKRNYSEIVRAHMPAHITSWVHNMEQEDLPNNYNMLE